MTKQIEAMKLALEALEKTQNEGYNLPGSAIREAITAIKEALAEHAMSEVQRLGQEIEQEACKEMEKNAICSPFMISELWRLNK